MRRCYDVRVIPGNCPDTVALSAATYVDNDERLPGALTCAEVDADPDQASALAIGGDYVKVVTTARVAAKTSWVLDANRSLTAGLSYEAQSSVHPIVDRVTPSTRELTHRERGSILTPVSRLSRTAGWWTTMRLRHLSSGARSLLVAAGSTLIAAALLIAFLQQRHEAEQQEQTKIISEQICERTAALLASRIRQQFEAAFVDTVEGIDHDELREARLRTIAPALAAGLEKHAYVDRFFFWNQRFPAAFEDQVLFYNPGLGVDDAALAVVDDNGSSLGGFELMEPFGRELLAIAHAPDNLGQTLILLDREIGGIRYQVVAHTYGAERWPEDVPGIIGFMVNLDTVGRSVLAEIVVSEFARLMPLSSDAPRLGLHVVDETGIGLVGAPGSADVVAGRTAIDLAFYPTTPTPWNARERAFKVPTWSAVVSAPPSPAGFATRDYLFGAVLLLILIALGCAALLNRQSERLSRLHADFVANVTHQLKTPLSLLAAASETLEHERLRTPEKVRDYAALVGHQTKALTRLVERILRLSRIDAASVEYDFKPVELVELVEGTVERFGESFKGRPGTLTFEATSRRVIVEGDAASLEEAVVNLIENASKYTDGHGTVRVRVDGDEREASVSIADDGMGIERDDLPHVFEKFYRGRNHNGSVRGFGVGLAIVQGIVHAHRGRISVESEIGRGSEFRMVFPSAPAGSTEAAPP
jgi:signal transduction histidine kinase